MKSIIDGKRYDTETAKEIADWQNEYYPNDFKYCREVLYRTKKGAWFLFGDGGAMSIYSKRVGSNTCGGSCAIVPLDDEEAKSWLEKKGFTNELEIYFQDSIEDA